MLEIIRTVLKNKGNKKISASQKSYFKGVINFHGLKSPELKETFKELYNEHFKTLSNKEQIKLGFQVLENDYSEEKQIGIYILNKNIKHFESEDFNLLEPTIEKYVYDWGYPK
jgi:hypothetical protein